VEIVLMEEVFIRFEIVGRFSKQLEGMLVDLKQTQAF
jgi:hypothetical protein